MSNSDGTFRLVVVVGGAALAWWLAGDYIAGAIREGVRQAGGDFSTTRNRFGGEYVARPGDRYYGGGQDARSYGSGYSDRYSSRGYGYGGAPRYGYGSGGYGYGGRPRDDGDGYGYGGRR